MIEGNSTGSVTLKHSQLANQPAINQLYKYASEFEALLNIGVSCRKEEQFAEPSKKPHRASSVYNSIMNIVES